MKEDLWKEAIDINMTDGLKPSEFLQNLIELNKKGLLSEEEIIIKLRQYYEKNN